MSAPFAEPLKAFKAAEPSSCAREEVVVSTPDWQGPLALLVDMAQRRRIDLKAVSMVDLVTACLDSLSSFDRIEDKAEQLVLAADLTLMKSRLLIGAEDEREDEEDALRQQALKLQRIQRVAALMMGRDQLGREIWPRGAPEIETDRTVAGADDLTIVDVIQAYARLRLHDEADAPMEVRRILVMTLAEALAKLGARLEELDSWTELFAWVGQGARPKGVSARSQAAASFVAALEMAKQGQVELRQGEAFGEVKVVKGFVTLTQMTK